MVLRKKPCTRAEIFPLFGLEPQTLELDTWWTLTRVLPSKTRTRLKIDMKESDSRKRRLVAPLLNRCR